MKRIFYSVAILAATMIGFTSCDEEDEKVDIKEQAVGDYNVTVQYWKVLVTLTKVVVL